MTKTDQHKSQQDPKMRAVFAAALITSFSFGVPCFANPSSATGPSSEKPIMFAAQSGEKVEAFEGSFSVPENRNNPESRKLTLRYVRFPSTAKTPGSPIVYLAGGPGGSGIDAAKRERFPLFMAMREFGDVIALDQRGTGASNDLPDCKSSQVIGSTSKLSDAEYDALFARAFRECLGFWKGKAVDVDGYNTKENATDLDALRKHLGSRKITLWGISYGTHLAMAAIKQMDRKLDKIVLSSAEGLEQTIKLPARTDAYFTRLQDAINGQPNAKAALPDIVAMIRRVHAGLEANPIMLTVATKEGGGYKYLWKRRDMQELASAMIADPASASLLLQLYSALDKGDQTLLNAMAPRITSANENITLRPMQTLMDVASGTSTKRRALIAMQAKTSLLSTFLNQTVTLEDVDPSLVMDDKFRERPVSDIPVLLLSGTLDGRTYIESQAEAVSGMRKRQIVTVKNAGHNLFMVSPEVTTVIQDFMRGKTVNGTEINAELPDMLSAGLSLVK
jgi:pimeloyl-ACP methyl ester carboxylesterase